MSEYKSAPQIRFKGFSDAWEQRKFENIFNYERPDKYIVNSTEYLEFGPTPVLTANKAFILGYTTEKNKYVNSHESIIFDDFTLDTKFVDFPYMVKSSAIKILTLKNEKKDNIRFNFELLSNHRFNMLGHARHYISVVQPEEVFTTNIQEQNKIGDLFTNLDNLITLHQRKYDNLVKVKKSLLEKMFPKNSSNVPEIRFKGFVDAWEQRKFDSLAKIDRGLTYSPTDLNNNGIRVLRSSNIDEDYFKLYDEDVFVNPESINIDFANNNDILITSANGSSRLVGKHAIISGTSSNSTVHGGFMLLAKPYINSYFLNASMSSNWYKKFIDLYVAGGNGAIGNLSKTDLDNQLVHVPKEREIIKIGELFKNLDNLITLHQRKLEKLNKLKKSMLDKMFI